MRNIRIYGRRGQGSIVAANLLQQAALLSGSFAEAIAARGSGRRDAQVSAAIQIYKVGVEPDSEAASDFVIVQDHTLLHSLGVTDDLASNTRVLVNWSETIKPTTIKGHRIMVMPADCIAMELIGRPIPNTALLAALIATTGMLPLKALEGALAMRFRGEVLENNLKLVRHVAQIVPAGLWKETAGAIAEPVEAPQVLLH